MSKLGSKIRSKRQQKPDAFAAALAMLGGAIPRTCPTCVGRLWYLGRTGPVPCNICRGTGVR